MDKEDFEQWAEENGMEDDLPDTADRYVNKISKTEISDEEFDDISNKIERRSEHEVGSISRKNEDIENDITLVKDDCFDVRDWTYDTDPQIKKIANESALEIDQYWSDAVELLNNTPNLIENGADLVQYLLEKEGIDVQDEWKGRASMGMVIHSFTIEIMGKTLFDKKIDVIKEKSPIAFAIVKHFTVENIAKETIKARLIELGRGTKALKHLELSDYPIVTPKNPDLSYACNPWSEDVLSDELKARINEAKQKVKFNF